MRSIAVEALASAMLLAGCLKATVNRCDKGGICPSEQACTERTNPDHPLCGNPDDVAACFHQPDHSACNHPDSSPGSCLDNLCIECNPNWVECRYPSWTRMDAISTEPIHWLSVVGPGDVYAVANMQLLHYARLVWSVSATFAGPLKAVWAIDGDDVFVVNANQVYRNDSTRLEYTLSSALRIFGISGTGLDYVVAVGSSGKLAVRDGGMWNEATVGTNALNDVWLASDMTGFAVGLNGTVARGRGGSWTLVPGTAGIPAATDSIQGIWGIGPSDIYLVGTTQAQAGFVYHYDGALFTAMQLPPNTPPLEKVWGSGSGSVYAVGASGTVLHYDGASWTANVLDGAVKLQTVGGVGHDVLVAGDTGSVWKFSEP